MQKSAIQGFRLSPQQHRLWSLQQAAPASSFRAQLAASLDGPLDYERLSGALAEVIRRHEILRTTFPSFSGITRPVQVVTRGADIKPAALPASDLSGLDAPGQETSVRELFDRELHADFDFERGPLVRASLAKLSAERHLLVLSLPALCADAHSLRGLLAELVGAYGGRPRGGDEPLQYADVAEWQNELVEGEDAKAGRAYWRKQQVGGQERVRLPLWQERAADGSDYESTGVVSVELDAEVCRRVEEAAGRCGTRAEVFLLGCWQVLLWRVSGEPSVTVGAAFDGRNYAELEEVSGPLVRFLPVRSHLRKAMSMAESLTQLDQVMRESYECQEYFTWELFDQTTPSAPGPESFNFCYEYEEWPESYTAAGLTLKHFDSYVCAERADLRLRCVRAGLRLKAEFHYSRQLYSAAEIGYLAEQYAALLEDAVERGDAPIAELKVLSERQRRQLLHDWNDTRADFPTDLCAHHLFERQAARTPYAVAVVCEGKSLSYRELDARADRLARLLRGRSVGAETTVAACFERSLEMVVALLGVLKAGGAYVPLDPAYPRERLSLMLRDSGAAALLTQASLADSLPEFAGATLCLDSEWGSVLSYEGESPRVSVLAEQLAYVIYTSGSTGAPKGVSVEHRQLVNYVLAASSRLELPESGAYACVSTPAADLGHTMIFPALLRGATLHLLTAECAADPVLLAEYFGRHEIDCLKVVPSHLSALLAGGTAVLPRRRLVLGGEALRSQLVERIRAAAPEGLRLYNHYGPTETAVGVLAGEVCEEEGGGAVALGRAMANTRAYVLDRGLEPVPVGVKGELYIGGAQVSRGYLNRPGLTAERFLPDPYAAEAGARMYRTGDVARYLADGRVGFVGRGDGQVKVRGYRVELGEVEAAARQHPAVSECVVVAREGEAQAGDGAAGEKRLAAYVVAHPHCRADYDGQRRYRLPNGMSVCHRNRDETDLLYREIFADECYLRHGVRLGPSAVVLDVGANVGMFSLFAAARGARLHSFEPIGEVYECLRRNAELARLSADSEIKTYHIGLGASEREETFTYYPRQTVLSGASRHADAAHELEVVKAAMRNEREAGAEGMSALLAEAEEVLGGKFEAREERCRVRRLADVLREDGVGRVDLLKVDVQGAEAEVLAGIEPEQWAGIGQVVVEVHDEEGRGSEGRLEEIRRRLEGLGFRVAVEQERRLAGTDRHDLYAVRDGWWDDERGPAASTGEVRGGLMGVLTAEELRGHLTLLLPDYMVPSHVVLLDALPLTPNGKVDRRALPAPAAPRQAAGGGEAHTPFEEMLCGLWAEVLGREQVGPEEDFFEAGGHSLLATQVTARVRGRFGVEVRLRSLFERPTPRGLGREVERLLREGAGAEAAPPLVARGGGGGGGGVRAASYAQRRLWFMQQLDEGGAAYNCPGGARLVGELDVAALERALGEVVRRHEALRTSFREDGGEVVQVVSAPEPVALMVRDLSMVERAERELVVEEIAQRQAREGFDLSRGPLLRAELLRVSAEEHVFLLTMHHIVSDGWSMGILIRELGALYEAYRAGAGSPLKELEVQYGDYAEWQRGWMSGEVLRQEVEWWRERLRGGEEVLRLPADRERGVEQRYVGGQVSFEVDAEESEGLRALSRREGCTLFMTLLAAFQTLLCRYTQQETIRVGTPVAGRGQLATEGLIGFFVNTVVMQTELGGNPTFRGLLARVREAALEAYAHQEVPFEKLVEELRPERSLRGTPLFNVWFALRNNTPATEIKLKSLTLGEFTSEATTAKFDLGLLMSDTQQRLKGAFEYDSDLFNVGTIEEMVGHFKTLLREVMANPDLPILDIPLLVEEGGERADEVPDYHAAADVEAEFSF